MSRSYCERRRRMLTLHPTVLRLESRNSATPVFATAMGVGIIGGTHASNKGGNSLIDSGSSAVGTGPVHRLESGQSPGSSSDLLVFRGVSSQQAGGAGAAGPDDTDPEIGASLDRVKGATCAVVDPGVSF
jgi:hypothetical protein